ncbi:MAG TPA: ABC transporter substrate-binding protein [Candidatus Limnocylindrales bacterium]|jgi:NitT/TauT family transport system substrate-binding protein|nr:ABC transporter substrate-binding protein [Candidatus Limnocylindrales bacterium]
MTRIKGQLALGAALVLAAAACSPSGTSSAAPTTGAGSTTTAPGSAAPTTAARASVKLQLQWVTQAQFAGYYAALDQGYYDEAGLDVSILIGGPQVNNVQVVASGGADIGVAWLPNMLRSREGSGGTPGTDLVSISQIFSRSGTRMVSFKDKNITKPADMIGKKIGSWLGGNEPELFAALTKAGADPASQNIIQQNFDMTGLLSGDLDVAQAMIYNEYAQVLEAKNPATGALYKDTDLNVVDFNDPSVGTAMLQDQLFASAAWLAKPGNEDVATRFLTASYRGWIYCRDNAQKCVDIVLAKGSQLGASHQAWQMNEINGLIWPSTLGIGQFDKAAYDQTVQIATTYKVLAAAPSADATRSDLAAAALAALPAGTDAKGASFAKQTITLNEGGN